MERDAVSGELNINKYISTHTLTWSVTVAGMEQEYMLKNFNSHAHVERDWVETSIYQAV